MRYHKVNEQAVSKTIAFLQELNHKIIRGEKIRFGELHDSFKIAKSTGSSIVQLGLIKEVSPFTYNWTDSFDLDRKLALKILDHNLHRSTKRVEQPLFPELFADIKSLLVEIRDNTKKQNNRSEGLKISERVYIAGQIANGYYTNGLQGDKMEITNDFIIRATDDLLNKLNS